MKISLGLHLIWWHAIISYGHKVHMRRFFFPISSPHNLFQQLNVLFVRLFTPRLSYSIIFLFISNIISVIRCCGDLLNVSGDWGSKHVSFYSFVFCLLCFLWWTRNTKIFLSQHLNGDRWMPEFGSSLDGFCTICHSGRWDESSTSTTTSLLSYSAQC